MGEAFDVILARLEERVNTLITNVCKITKDLDGGKFVTESDFKIVRAVVYGMVTIALVAVLTAVFKLVIF